MKKMLSVVLLICILLCILPTTVFAATMISKSDISVNAPEAGVAPIVFASVLNQSLEVIKVEWVGELDANGCFMANTAYTINITIRIKAGQDKYLVDNGGFRVNKKKAVMTSLSGDGQEAVISYTFDNGAGSASVKVPPEATPTEPATTNPTALNDANFYVEAPVQGAKPSTVVTTDRSDLFDISGVKWTGEFDSNGCFIAKNIYRLHFNITVKDGVNVIIPSKGVESIRNYRINGKLLTTGAVVGDGKQLQTGINFEVALPKEAVDMDYVYSEAKADADRTIIYPDVIIVNEGESLGDHVDIFNDKQMNSVRKVVLNYTYNKHHYGEDDTKQERVTGDSSTFMSFYNLEELWLGPNVDVADFLADYGTAHMGYAGTNSILPLTSTNHETQKLTMFVSDQSLPNGFTGNWNRIQSPIGADGYIDLGPGPFKRFQSRLYSGDVLEAFKKGPSAAYEWCTDHDYSEINNTADRVYRMISCTQPTLYYYSCSKCGKCEYNPNHVDRSLLNLSGNYHMLIDLADHYMKERNLSDKYYIGTNSRGERVYWKSCVVCGATHGEVLFGYIEPKNPEWARENATVTKDYVDIAFAVRGDSHVTAKMSEWAQNDVQWASQNGILDLNLLGSDYTKPITRLQFASIAVKLAEVLTGKEIIPADVGIFTDTDNEYALKAYSSGITSGVSATEFAPNGTLTRQQMATFIHRALMYVRDNTNIRYTIYTPELEKYSDNWAIQDWARTPMGFMNALGLVKGVSDTAIDPDGFCTIEQAAVVANRSVNADQIGWYQSKPAIGDISLDFNNDFFHAPDEHTPTQADYTNGLRVWVHSPMSGYQKASENPDVRIDVIQGCWLPTTYPFADFPMWLQAEDFKPIKDLKPDDEANFNKFYGK